MEKYRKTLIIRIILLSVLALIGVGMGIFDAFWAQKHSENYFLFCFQCGFSEAMGLVSLMWAVRYRVALKAEKKLQILYNKENDERMKTIKAKAGLPVILIFSVVLILTGMVVGYFNATVFYTLITVANLQLIVSSAIKLAYMKIL